MQNSVGGVNPVSKILVALFLACGFFAAHAEPVSPQAQLKALLDDDLDAVFRRVPFQATVRGIPGYDHLLPDLSLAELAKQQARERSMVTRLKAIDAKALQGQDRVSYELLLEK